MSVNPGISTTDLRAKGFEDAVKEDSKFPYLGVQYSKNDPATAANLIGSALQKGPHFAKQGVRGSSPLGSTPSQALFLPSLAL
jgi:ABC-type sugar transport system substrate-binding protein